MPVSIQKIPEKIIANYEKDNHIYLSKCTQQKIDKYWDMLLSKGRDLFKGKLFCMNSFYFDGNTLTLDISKSNYAHYLYSVNHKMISIEKCSSLFTAALLRTADDFFVIGQMGSHTSTPERLQCAGGGVDIKDLKGNQIDFEQNMKNELTEELNLQATNSDHIETLYRQYLKTGGESNNIAVMFHVKTPMTKNELTNHFHHYIHTLHQENKKSEFKKLYFIKQSKEAVINFFKNTKLPVADYLEVALLKDITA